MSRKWAPHIYPSQTSLYPLPALLVAEVLTGLVDVSGLTVVETPEVFMVPRNQE